MLKFDSQQKVIVRELIKDPRISDNKISKKTGIPLKTVNRKRKVLEEKGILNYLAYIEHGKPGTGQLKAKQLFIVFFKHGITRNAFLDEFLKIDSITHAQLKHVFEAHIGEANGRLALVLYLDSRQEEDLLEIYNVEIVPLLRERFGEDCIHSTQVITITSTAKLLRNYFPSLNLEKGKLKQDWPDQLIYVGE